MAKKKILTEDAFNANGSTHVDEKVLNENANIETATEDSANDEKIDNKDEMVDDTNSNNDDTIITSSDESSEDVKIVENNDVSITETDVTSEIDDVNRNDVAENNEEVIENSKVLESNINNNLTSKKTLTRYNYGFNDEDYYTKAYIN